MNYTFFYLYPDRKVPSFDLIDCDGESEARAKLPQIFAERRNCEAVEVWDERGRGCVERREPFA